MRQLLFNLQGVPEQEADEVRALLNDNEVLFYETTAGRWRIGLAAIWLPNKDQLQQAELLLDNYQQNRIEQGKEERERLRHLGFYQGFLEQFYTQPLKVIAALVGIIVVLMVSILPFVF
jgi:hypothetical protein